MGQFKKAMFKSDAFKMLFKKLKEGKVRRNTPEYDKILENLARISKLSIQEIENCIEVSL